MNRLRARASLRCSRHSDHRTAPPASRLGLLLGRVLRDTVVLLIQAALLAVIVIAFGPRVPLVGALITVGIVGLA
jgi:ABC-2 type transport system permease protein